MQVHPPKQVNSPKKSASLTPKVFFDLLKETFKEWQEDKVARLAAALAYYTAFSLAPLLIIAIAIAAMVFGREAAQNQLVWQIQDLVGKQGAEAIQEMIANSQKPSEGIFATGISIVILLFGASGVFAELQDSLNTIWEVAPKPNRGIKGMLHDRFLSFSMVLGIGFLLLVSLLLTALLSGVGNYFGNLMPGFVVLSHILNLGITFVVVTLLFAMIYRILPDAKIAWSDVWIGAIITSVLFTIGKQLIGLYLGNNSIGSTYGAAGSFVVLLLWVNYSAQILFFGAEFTQVYANKFGSHIVPADNAIPLTEKARVNQGIPHEERLKAAANGQEAVDEPRSRRPNQKKSPHPAAIMLSMVVGAYQGVTQRGKKKNNRRRSK